MKSLEEFRREIDQIDQVLLSALGRRLGICAEVARFKRDNNIPMMQPSRVETVKNRAADQAKGHGLRGDFVRELYGLIIGEACRLEDDIIDAEGPAHLNETARAHFAVLGAAGAMGNLIAARLKHSGHHVAGYDLRQAGHAADFETFTIADVCKMPPKELDGLAKADCVVVCLPHEPAMEAIGLLAPRLAPGALMVDTLSVKVPVIDEVKALPVQCQYLSLNPMFAPSLGFKGQKVVAVVHRAGERVEATLRMISDWGSTIERRSAEDHDRACAVMQVATHMALLCLGRTIVDSRIDVAELLKIAPPPHVMCLAMLSRILTAAPETYFDIQRDNPFGEEVRQQLAAALADFDGMAKRGDSEKFAAALESMRQTFEAQLETLTKTSANAIRGAMVTGSSNGAKRP